ncbi:hypothetical protein BCR41DRAFT_375849 [Lobosporangium transversale]|uniref:Uncharacterized protein n=1 Tax=Lobosporangium transversale TaxID=64571 RepID=A0A1Y2G887_9FUNG|nr:hypothetical protein BCR41DRAFT_375849 [Lobosporangium transversale]ORY95985.1 hypothetical protein BCR41DRAFT_375849 [Lobosporangium transversale]|eukprot:XP_021875426.1 hypothetical protein BCR41DRAFT_375849 [Lobosporangium transversale]
MFNFEDCSRHLIGEALQTNKEYVDVSVFHYYCSKEYSSLQGCRHLRHIDYHEYISSDLSNFIKAHNPTIIELRLYGYSVTRDMEGNIAKKMMSIWDRGHGWSRHQSFYFRMPARKCPGLCSLSFNGCNEGHESTQ